MYIYKTIYSNTKIPLTQIAESVVQITNAQIKGSGYRLKLRKGNNEILLREVQKPFTGRGMMPLEIALKEREGGIVVRSGFTPELTVLFVAGIFAWLTVYILIVTKVVYIKFLNEHMWGFIWVLVCVLLYIGSLYLRSWDYFTTVRKVVERMEREGAEV